MKELDFKSIKTNSWHTIDYLGLPASKVNFVYVERTVPEPESAKKIREETWLSKLEERKEALEKINTNNHYEIKYDEETRENALFETETTKKKMWAGQTITFSGLDFSEQKSNIFVHPISYTEWIACYNPKYAETFEECNLKLPYAGIGVSVVLESKDGLIPLTRRGIETPVYPGKLYSPGGGPKVRENSTEALLQEILEETGLDQQFFNPNDLKIMALIADTNFAGSKHSRPELVARLMVNLNYREIEDIQQESVKKKGFKESDVWGIEPVSKNLVSLEQKIKFDKEQMCPPTEAALTYLLYELYEEREGPKTAFSKIGEFTRTLNKYKREAFKPPIHILTS